MQSRGGGDHRRWGSSWKFRRKNCLFKNNLLSFFDTDCIRIVIFPYLSREYQADNVKNWTRITTLLSSTTISIEIPTTTRNSTCTVNAYLITPRGRTSRCRNSILSDSIMSLPATATATATSLKATTTSNTVLLTAATTTSTLPRQSGRKIRTSSRSALFFHLDRRQVHRMLSLISVFPLSYTHCNMCSLTTSM